MHVVHLSNDWHLEHCNAAAWKAVQRVQGIEQRVNAVVLPRRFFFSSALLHDNETPWGDHMVREKRAGSNSWSVKLESKSISTKEKGSVKNGPTVWVRAAPPPVSDNYWIKMWSTESADIHFNVWIKDPSVGHCKCWWTHVDCAEPRGDKLCLLAVTCSFFRSFKLYPWTSPLNFYLREYDGNYTVRTTNFWTRKCSTLMLFTVTV